MRYTVVFAHFNEFKRQAVRIALTRGRTKQQASPDLALPEAFERKAAWMNTWIETKARPIVFENLLLHHPINC